MAPNGQIAIPLDIAAIREPYLACRFWHRVFVHSAEQECAFMHAATLPRNDHHWRLVNGPYAKEALHMLG